MRNPPEKFPFKNAIKKMWTVIYFEDAGPSRTRLRIVGTGYGNDEESQKLRTLLRQGNAYTLKKLQEKFAGKEGKPSNQRESPTVIDSDSQQTYRTVPSFRHNRLDRPGGPRAGDISRTHSGTLGRSGD